MRALGITVVIALSALAAEAQQAAPPAFDATRAPIKDLIERARLALEAGNPAASLELLRAAYAREPNPVFLQNMAKVLERLDRHAEAVAQLELALAAPELPAELRKTAEAQLADARKRAALAWPRFPRARPDLAIYVRDVKVTDPSARVAVAPGEALVSALVADKRELVVRRVHLAAGGPTDIADDLATPRFDDGWIALGAEPLDALTIDGTPLPIGARPGDRLRLARGAWTVRARTRSGELREHSGPIEPQQTVELSATAAPSPPPPALTGSVPPPAPYATVWPTVLAGTGGALAGAGAVLLVLAHADAEPLSAADADGTTRLTRAQADALDARVSRESTAGVLLLAGGVAALALATTWLLTTD